MQENAEQDAEDAEQDAKIAEALKINKLIQDSDAGWAPVPKIDKIPGIIVPLEEKKILVEHKTGCIILTDAGNPITSNDPFVFDWENKIDMDVFRGHVGFYEGNIQHMYLDVKLNVTVGIGHLIENAAEAEKLPFYHRHSENLPFYRRHSSPHPLHVKNAFDKVLRNKEKAPDGASAFKDITHLDLDLNVIEVLFEDDVRSFIKQLYTEYPDFFSYPGSAKMGMLDLIYNMGKENFFYPKFPMFHDALKFRNWPRVAEESHRDNEINGVKNLKIEDRNIKVNGWFMDAMDKEPFFIDVDCPHKRLSQLVS